MSTRAKVPVVIPHLASGEIPQQGMTVEHPDGTRGPLLYTVPRRGCDRPTEPTDWQTLVRTPTGRAVRRLTRELHTVTS
jgi:hypothetical protein